MDELTHERLADLDLAAGRMLIEAGAGSGKTYTLASLHLKLVLQGVEPRAIGAVTFTNAATEELRGRLRERLGDAERGVEGEAAIREEPWWPLVEAARRQLGDRELLRLLRRARAGMDEAPIYTIHRLCLHLLRRHPGAVSLDPALDPDADDRLEQAARDFWRRQVLGEEEAWESLAALGIHEPDELVARLRRALPLRPLPWPEAPEAVDTAAARAALERLRVEIEETLGRELEPLLEGLKAHPDCLNGNRYPADDKKGYWWEEIPDPLEAWRWGERALPQRLGNDHLRGSINKSCKEKLEPWLDGFRLPPLVDEWNRRLEALKESRVLRGCALLLQALKTLPGQAARLRMEAGELSPDDLLRLTRDALHGEGGERLAEAIAAEMPWLLVDEFQDTDSLQYAILKRLESVRNGVRLILIGDPKQAIYAFRGADVHAYLRAREETDPARRFRLTANHRSRPAVCRAVNRLFDGESPFAQRGLEHPPARAAAEGEALELPGAIDPAPGKGLTLWTLGEGAKGIKPSVVEALEICAESAAAHVAALLEAGRKDEARIGGDPVTAEHIALLVREHAQAEALRRALAARGIASACASRDSVFAGEAARGLCAWLEALAEPEAPDRLRIALADPLTGLDLAGLYHALGEGWEAWLERLCDLHAMWRRHGVLAAVLRLLEVLEPVTVARRLEGERLLTDLLHLAELLQAESARRREPTLLAAWFRERVEAPPAGEEAVLRLESERDAVRILTIHKAKGLEFPIVYLPFLWRSSPVDGTKQKGKALFTFHHDGAWRVAFGREGGGAERADRERLSEELRLLYVALTRAKSKLFGWIGPVGEAAGRGGFDWLLADGEKRLSVLEKEELFRFHEDLGKRNNARGDKLKKALETWRAALSGLAGEGIEVSAGLPGVDGHPKGEALPGTPACAPLPPPCDLSWRITSYSGIVRGQHRTVDYDAEEEAVAAWGGEGREHFPPGAATGNFLHRLLEETDYTRPEWEARREAIERLRLRFGLPGGEGWWPRLVGWMDRVLAAPLPEGGSLSGIAFADRLHEVVFHFRLRGARARELDALLREHGIDPPQRWAPGGRLEGLLTGAIDLLYRHEGRYHVADFKSNLLPGYGPARLRQAMAERHYDLQYLLYTLALHRHLRLRLPGYDYDTHFGGVRYLFLRGMSPDHPGQGVFDDRPPRALVEGLDRLMEGGA